LFLNPLLAESEAKLKPLDKFSRDFKSFFPTDVRSKFTSIAMFMCMGNLIIVIKLAWFLALTAA